MTELKLSFLLSSRSPVRVFQDWENWWGLWWWWSIVVFADSWNGLILFLYLHLFCGTCDTVTTNNNLPRFFSTEEEEWMFKDACYVDVPPRIIVHKVWWWVWRCVYRRNWRRITHKSRVVLSWIERVISQSNSCINICHPTLISRHALMRLVSRLYVILYYSNHNHQQGGL